MEKEEKKGRGDSEEEEEGGEGKRESERRGGEWGQNRERTQKNEEVQEQQNPLISKPETSHNIFLFSFWVSFPITHKVQALGIREQQKLDAEKTKSGSFPIKEITKYLGYTKYKFG